MRASLRPTGHIRSIPMKLGNQVKIQYKGMRHPEAFLRPIPLPIGPRYWRPQPQWQKEGNSGWWR